MPQKLIHSVSETKFHEGYIKHIRNDQKEIYNKILNIFNTIVDLQEISIKFISDFYFEIKESTETFLKFFETNKILELTFNDFEEKIIKKWKEEKNYEITNITDFLIKSYEQTLAYKTFTQTISEKTKEKITLTDIEKNEWNETFNVKTNIQKTFESITNLEEFITWIHNNPTFDFVIRFKYGVLNNETLKNKKLLDTSFSTKNIYEKINPRIIPETDTLNKEYKPNFFAKSDEGYETASFKSNSDTSESDNSFVQSSNQENHTPNITQYKNKSCTIL